MNNMKNKLLMLVCLMVVAVSFGMTYANAAEGVVTTEDGFIGGGTENCVIDEDSTGEDFTGMSTEEITEEIVEPTVYGGRGSQAVQVDAVIYYIMNSVSYIKAEGTSGIMAFNTKTKKISTFVAPDMDEKTGVEFTDLTYYEGYLYYRTYSKSGAVQKICKVNLKNKKKKDLVKDNTKSLSQFFIYKKRLYYVKGNELWKAKLSGKSKKKVGLLKSKVGTYYILDDVLYYGAANDGMSKTKFFYYDFATNKSKKISKTKYNELMSQVKLYTSSSDKYVYKKVLFNTGKDRVLPTSYYSSFEGYTKGKLTYFTDNKMWVYKYNNKKKVSKEVKAFSSVAGRFQIQPVGDYFIVSSFNSTAYGHYYNWTLVDKKFKDVKKLGRYVH